MPIISPAQSLSPFVSFCPGPSTASGTAPGVTTGIKALEGSPVCPGLPFTVTPFLWFIGRGGVLLLSEQVFGLPP